MGVVRSTVDFYWRNKLQQRAIDVLTQAAKDSYPSLRTRFNFEAARKMTEFGQFAAARKLLLALLEGDDYNGEYLAAVAETYARSSDNTGLRDFYQGRIKLFQKSSLAGDERKERVATLRRGLIPALTSLNDYAGGVDQYIEIINAYPEDAALVNEAANYAQRYRRKDQLLNFYAKTVAASPKDSRWTVVLARVQTNNEDFDAAVTTYAQAIKIRPDRVELVSAKATLEERLMRFDQAAADFAVLYELAYHDAKWMEKVAEIRARQGLLDQTVHALQVALIDGRPEAPGKYFTVAERLEGWGMLAPAREFADKGVALAGPDLLANTDNHGGAQTYTHIMVHMRQQDAAYQKLQAALEAARQLPPIALRVAKNGIESVTNTELRKSMLTTRNGNARAGMTACLREMGSAVNKFFTPEERVEFVKAMDTKNATMSRRDAVDYLLPLAEKAGISELQATLVYDQIAASNRYVSTAPLEQLQIRRLKLTELGQQLERIAMGKKPDVAPAYLYRAQEIYNLAGSEEDELRVLEAVKQYQVLSGAAQNRYFELLLARNPQRLLHLSSEANGRGYAAVNFIVAHSDAKLALPAVDARGASEAPVWRHAYTALVGLYFANSSPQVQSAFRTALAEASIGERLAMTADRKQSLAGDVWFYYGSRYGEYLGATKKGDPEEYLPAEVEHTPARAPAYFTTAFYYEDAGDFNRAISDYQHVADLDAGRIDVHNRLAGIYWKQKRTDEALSEWRRALQLLKAQITTEKTLETFWGDFDATVSHLAGHQLLTQFQPDINEILHDYVKRNGSYRLQPLLQSMLPRMESPGAASTLLSDFPPTPQRSSLFCANTSASIQG